MLFAKICKNENSVIYICNMPNQMNIQDFVAGSYVQQYEYKSFSPSFINKEWIISDPKILSLNSTADRLLGELNAFSQLIPNVDFFIQMHVTKEATTSSRIEGTKTSVQEAFIDSMDIDPEKRDDHEEVRNYIDAMNYAVATLEKLPFSNRLLKQTHEVLLKGVRGKHKLPGEFRSSQNWIGGNSLKNAYFIPPIPTEVANHMSDLEKFLNNEEIYVPHLIRIGIGHYQFETIHPFLDGNGRLGRLMITLYLVEHGLLKKPTLYLSDFFERNKGFYYDHLSAVRQTDDLKGWIQFFLEGIIETSQNSINTFKAIIKLREKVEQKITTMGSTKSRNAQKLIQYLYSHPIVSVLSIEKDLGLTYATANRLIQDFIDLDILTEASFQKRNRLFAFEEYLNIFQ